MSELIEPKKNSRHRGNGAVQISNMGRGFGYFRTVLTVLTFTAGVILSMLIQNISQTEAVQFSTVGLLGFLVAVSLSVAAIVASIAAVTLGYLAQKEMRLIGEESLSLQNEVMNRTIEAVLKVEASARALHVS